MKAENFSAVVDGKQVTLHTLSNGNGLKMSVINFGARVVELWVPDSRGVLGDVVLGYDDLGRYLDTSRERFMGAVCGRVANRICGGKFDIGGTPYDLPLNNNGNTLHGGTRGLDSVMWDIEDISRSSILFSYFSPHMEEGFPGNLSIAMRYELTDDNEFRITYSAKTDRPTHVNLTHHSFFNLKGEGMGTIDDHILQIDADRYTPVDTGLIPIGELHPVADTPMDFLRPAVIGSRVGEDFPQLRYAKGYDHNWVLNKKSCADVEFAAAVCDPASGRRMEVWTDQPGLQFYGGNFFDGKTVSKRGGSVYGFREAFALETQFFPDSPNQPLFPSTLLLPTEEYIHNCIYRFISG